MKLFKDGRGINRLLLETKEEFIEEHKEFHIEKLKPILDRFDALEAPKILGWYFGDLTGYFLLDTKENRKIKFTDYIKPIGVEE